MPMAPDPRRDIAVVRHEIDGLPALIRAQIGATWGAVQSLLDGLAVDAIPRVVLTGCGDSYFAGLAARWAFERHAGLPAEAIEALPRGALVLPISYSGQVARTVEAARNARNAGATVLAVTGRPER